MTNIRRYYVPDSIVFITQVVEGRVPVFRSTRHFDLLREIMHVPSPMHNRRGWANELIPACFCCQAR
jgi:hypothetical protein